MTGLVCDFEVAQMLNTQRERARAHEEVSDPASADGGERTKIPVQPSRRQILSIQRIWWWRISFTQNNPTGRESNEFDTSHGMHEMLFAGGVNEKHCANSSLFMVVIQGADIYGCSNTFSWTENLFGFFKCSDGNVIRLRI